MEERGEEEKGFRVFGARWHFFAVARRTHNQRVVPQPRGAHRGHHRANVAVCDVGHRAVVPAEAAALARGVGRVRVRERGRVAQHVGARVVLPQRRQPVCCGALIVHELEVLQRRGGRLQRFVHVVGRKVEEQRLAGRVGGNLRHRKVGEDVVLVRAARLRGLAAAEGVVGAQRGLYGAVEVHKQGRVAVAVGLGCVRRLGLGVRGVCTLCQWVLAGLRG